MLKPYRSLFKTAENGRDSRGALGPQKFLCLSLDVPNNWHNLTGHTPHVHQCFNKRHQTGSA